MFGIRLKTAGENGSRFRNTQQRCVPAEVQSSLFMSIIGVERLHEHWVRVGPGTYQTVITHFRGNYKSKKDRDIVIIDDYQR